MVGARGKATFAKRGENFLLGAPKNQTNINGSLGLTELVTECA